VPGGRDRGDDFELLNTSKRLARETGMALDERLKEVHRIKVCSARGSRESDGQSEDFV
jgi:hypothetical protein